MFSNDPSASSAVKAPVQLEDVVCPLVRKVSCCQQSIKATNNKGA